MKPGGHAASADAADGRVGPGVNMARSGKARSLLSGREVDELHERLGERLERLGITTQPEVAMKILELVGRPDAGMADFAEVIRADAAISGRLLRVVNSAFFAQREPVTSIDRACVLLGAERLKAVALGFYLGSAAAGDASTQLARRIWGESIFRACLASELARATCPAHAAEAFVIGMLLDSGQPLMLRLVGEPFERLLVQRMPAARAFRAEWDTLEYTHVDVVAALAKRWKLPDLLAKPIERHHAHPGEEDSQEPVHKLHRIAYYVGSISVDAWSAAPDVPLAGLGTRVLDMDPQALREHVNGATRELGAIQDVFSAFASKLDRLDAISESAHWQLVQLTDEAISRQMSEEAKAEPQTVQVAGFKLQIEAESDGYAVAYLFDSHGERVAFHRFVPGAEEPPSIMEALGLDDASPEEAGQVGACIRRLAA